MFPACSRRVLELSAGRLQPLLQPRCRGGQLDQDSLADGTSPRPLVRGEPARAGQEVDRAAPGWESGGQLVEDLVREHEGAGIRPALQPLAEATPGDTYDVRSRGAVQPDRDAGPAGASPSPRRLGIAGQALCCGVGDISGEPVRGAAARAGGVGGGVTVGVTALITSTGSQSSTGRCR